MLSTTATPVQAAPASPDASVAQGPVETQGAITYTLDRSANPSDDERDAYARIQDAMDRAVARYNRLTSITKHMNVYYAPGVPTAEANYNGDVRFGSNRGFMQEGTALHEMGHVMGIGFTGAWYGMCGGNGSGQWSGPIATRLLESWDGQGARINCGGRHIWPYGLNFSNEYDELNFERHAMLVQAMVEDGMMS